MKSPRENRKGAPRAIPGLRSLGSAKLAPEAVIPLHRNAARALGVQGDSGRTITVNAPITVTVHKGGDNIEAQVMRAMKRSTSQLIEQLKRAEREDFRLAIV